MLCSICTGFNFAGLIQQSGPLFHDLRRPAVAFRHQPSYAALLSSAEHCGVCGILLKALRASQLGENVKISQDFTNIHQELDDLGVFPFYLSAHGSDLHQKYSLVQKAAERIVFRRARPESFGKAFKEIYTLPGVLTSIARGSTGYIRLSPDYSTSVQRQPDSIAERRVPRPSRIDLAQHWIQSCSADHAECPSVKDTVLPTRVLDCSTTASEIHLIETGGLKGRYVTLSHCWGKSGKRKPIVTALDNIDARKNGIPLDQLPLTFQDSVIVVRKLGFRYLWIDSLCIIQGDSADWFRECKLMARYYSHSSLTIAGPAAKDASAGFLQHNLPPLPPGDTDQADNRAISWRAEHNSRGGASTVRLGIKLYPFMLSGRNLDNLGTRGWVVQERLLSPRMLYFGKEQMWFECSAVTNFEALNYPIQHPRELLRDIPAPFSGKPEPVWQVPKNALLNLTYPMWYSVLNYFGRCSITEGNDNLPCISGLAASFATAFKDECLAGIWRKDMIFGLCWMVPENASRGIVKPASFSGPSWSWISTNMVFEHPLAAVPECHDYITWSAWRGSVDRIAAGVIAFCFDVLDACCTRSGDNSGLVEAGTISTVGKLIKCTLGPHNVLNLDGKPHQLARFFPDDGRGFEVEQISVECLLLAYHDGTNITHSVGYSNTAMSAIFGDSRPRYFALVLAAIDAAKLTYRRLGMALAESWSNDIELELEAFIQADERTVNIV